MTANEVRAGLNLPPLPGGDPYSVQTSGLVRFHARRRVGGGMTKAEAFKFLNMHA